jgi:hypothetical protein
MAADGNAVPVFTAICPQCSEAAPLNIVSSWDVFYRELGEATKWTVAKCGSCELPSVWSQDYLPHPMADEDGDPWSGYSQVYPQPDRALSTAIPQHVRDDFDEARTCIRSKAFTAAVIMLRRCIESICVERGVTKGPLVQRLKALRDSGVVDQRLYEWADACREVGNEGAHSSGKRTDPGDASEVMQLVEALLDYLYVFQARFEAFQVRRAHAAAAGGTTKP